ncbi:MAG: hypothetical protein FWB78_07400 [Treponema sp.]|nr:hypothetical protein [Treponema sp.]
MQKSRAFVFFLALLALQAVSLFAQEWEEDWDFHMTDMYARGDQTFTISLGVVFPTVFVFRDANGGGLTTDRAHNFSPPVGGGGSLAYNHFLGPRLFVGGEIGVSFNATLGGNMLYIIPIGLRAGWQFILGRFEFPVALTFGIAPQRYLDDGYLGIFLRGSASAFYRFNPEWSFGLNADWTWLPQRPRRDGRPISAENVDANMLGITISARYHF